MGAEQPLAQLCQLGRATRGAAARARARAAHARQPRRERAERMMYAASRSGDAAPQIAARVRRGLAEGLCRVGGGNACPCGLRAHRLARQLGGDHLHPPRKVDALRQRESQIRQLGRAVEAELDR